MVFVAGQGIPSHFLRESALDVDVEREGGLESPPPPLSSKMKVEGYRDTSSVRFFREERRGETETAAFG